MLKRLILVTAVAVFGATLVPAVAVAEPTVEDDIVIKSFDDTPIVATLMLPEGASASNPVPVVLQTHGWGGKRSRDPSTGFLKRLLDAGYAVFTWDQRGFGQSGGEANIDSPDVEVKDLIELIDYLGTRKEIQQDGPGDPHAGWIGGSYAGSIQLNTSSFDHRVDAIVPEIPWGNLIQDLYPNKVIKRSWDQLLYGAGAASATTEGIGSPAGPQTGNYHENIHKAEAQGTATAEFDKDLQDWFFHKSTILYAPKITVPTMVMQGTVDTLFPLEDGFDLYKILEPKVPFKLVTFCGGHTLGCPYAGGATGYPEGDREGSHYDDLKFNWLEHYVKGKTSVDVGPKVEWQAGNGYYYGASKYPVPGTSSVTQKKPRKVSLVGPGGSGGDGAADGNPAPGNEMGSTATRKQILGKKKFPRAIVGIPKVNMRGLMTAAEFGYVFMELVDKAPDGTLTTVDDQVMPTRLKNGEIAETLALHGVSWLLKPGHKLLLEVSTGSAQYDLVRTGPYTLDLKVKTKVPVSRKIGKNITK